MLRCLSQKYHFSINSSGAELPITLHFYENSHLRTVPSLPVSSRTLKTLSHHHHCSWSWSMVHEGVKSRQEPAGGSLACVTDRWVFQFILEFALQSTSRDELPWWCWNAQHRFHKAQQYNTTVSRCLWLPNHCLSVRSPLYWDFLLCRKIDLKIF